MTEDIQYGEAARESLKKGVDAVANAVKESLGVKGRNVVLGSRMGSRITKDGYSIARAIDLKDPVQCIGANIVKEVSFKTVKEAGDGTTTAMILAQAIVHEGFKNVTAGSNPMDLKRGIDKAVKSVVEHIKEYSTLIDVNSPKLEQIATISANNDNEIGKLVADVVAKTGKDGVVSIDDSKSVDTYIDVIEGLQFNVGYTSPYFINDAATLSCQLLNPAILVSQGKISTKKQIFNILEQAAKVPKPLLIIAEEVEGEALHLLIHHKVKSQHQICVVKAPLFGDAKKDALSDIAVCVGTKVVNDETGLRSETLKLDFLGGCEKVLITKDETTILGGFGTDEDIQKRIEHVRTELDLASNDYERGVIEKRLAKLIGGIGVIYIGMASEVEMNEKRDRVDDALRASKCAIQEGIAPGGGVSLIRCIPLLNELKYDNEDERAGIRIIQKAIESPFIQMCKNAGLENKVSIRDIEEKGLNFGYNFKTDKIEDLVEAGVVDPSLVIRVALMNAASMAGTLITSEALIVRAEDPNPMLNQMMQQR